jgi:hypothetical protein
MINTILVIIAVVGYVIGTGLLAIWLANYIYRR